MLEFAKGDLDSIKSLKFPINIISFDPGSKKMGVRYETILSRTKTKSIFHEVVSIGSKEIKWISAINRLLNFIFNEDNETSIKDVDICIVEKQLFNNPNMKIIEKIIQTLFWSETQKCIILSIDGRLKYKFNFFESKKSKQFKSCSMDLCLEILENMENDEKLIKRLRSIKEVKLKSDFSDPVLLTYSLLKSLELIDLFDNKINIK